MTTNHERREYMAGLIELMVDRCADRGLVYCDEMAVLVLAWLSASQRTGRRESPSRAILPEVPEIPAGVERTPGPGCQVGGQGGGQRLGHKGTLRLGDEIAGARAHRLGIEHAVEGITTKPLDPLPEPGAMPTITPNRRDSRFFRAGRDAALGGEPRSACPYRDGRGGFQSAWLTGYDEAAAELGVNEQEAGPGVQAPGPRGRGVKRESDAPHTGSTLD